MRGSWMKKNIMLISLIAALISLTATGCKNPSAGPSVADRIAADLAEIQSEADMILEDDTSPKEQVLNLITKIEDFIESNRSYLENENAVDTLENIIVLLNNFAENITYLDQLELFKLLFGNEITIPGTGYEELYAFSVQVEAYANAYGITLNDAEQVMEESGIPAETIAIVIDLINGVITLADLMVSETGMYTDGETGIVVGLPLESDIPAGSPITVNGTPTLVDDGERSGMDFNAAEDYLLIPADQSNDLTIEGTIDIWLKPSTNVAWAGIVHKGSQSDWSDEGYSFQYDGSKKLMLAMTSALSGQLILVKTQHTLTVGIWSHVVVTWNSSKAHIYVDGTDVTDKITKGFSSTEILISDYSPFRSSDGDVVIGTQLPGEPYRFDGVISDIKIYNTFFSE